jgi:hypothetical protein
MMTPSPLALPCGCTGLRTKQLWRGTHLVRLCDEQYAAIPCLASDRVEPHQHLTNAPLRQHPVSQVRLVRPLTQHADRSKFSGAFEFRASSRISESQLTVPQLR